MQNPLINGVKNIIVYIVLWAIVCTIHFLIVHSIYNYDIYYSLIDSLSFTGVFALLAIPLWYTVLYNEIDKINPLYFAIKHLVMAAVTIFLWISLVWLLYDLFLPEYLKYFTPNLSTFTGIILMGLFYYINVTLVYYVIIYYQKFKLKVFNEAELVARIHEAELSLLKSQVNPHFLFNSLNSVNSLTITNPEKAREMLVKLSEFMRYSLSHGDNQKIPFEQEVKNIERYLDIEKVRFGEKLHFEKQISEECLEASLPAMILQPLIENSVKHGVYEATDTVTIKLECLPVKDGLHIILRNNFDPDALPRKGAGIGIKNIASRLELIYHRNDLMEIEKHENYFIVHLIIPQNQ